MDKQIRFVPLKDWRLYLSKWMLFKLQLYVKYFLIVTFHAGAKPPLKSVIRASPKKFQYGGQNARKGFWSEFLRSPLQTSREKSRRVKTGYLEERNGGQIHVLEKTSFVLICKLPGLFLKRPCLKHAWSGERRQFTCRSGQRKVSF